jgi:hypothetical protein
MACHQLAIPFRSVLHRTGCTAAASVQPPAPRPTGRWARARRASVQKYRPYTVRPRVLVSFRFPSSRPLLLTPTSRRVQLDASSPPLAVGCCLLACLPRPPDRPPQQLLLLALPRQRRARRSPASEDGGGAVEVPGRLRPPNQAPAHRRQRCVPPSLLPRFDSPRLRWCGYAGFTCSLARLARSH